MYMPGGHKLYTLASEMIKTAKHCVCLEPEENAGHCSAEVHQLWRLSRSQTRKWRLHRLRVSWATCGEQQADRRLRAN